MLNGGFWLVYRLRKKKPMDPIDPLTIYNLKIQISAFPSTKNYSISGFRGTKVGKGSIGERERQMGNIFIYPCILYILPRLPRWSP